MAELLERVGLGDRMEHKPTELSGGQMQRVAIARALAMRPDVVLADEPTGNLDTSAGGDIMQLFTDLWKQGRTVVVITHDMTLARRASRIVEIHDGRIVSDTRRRLTGIPSPGDGGEGLAPSRLRQQGTTRGGRPQGRPYGPTRIVLPAE